MLLDRGLSHVLVICLSEGLVGASFELLLPLSLSQLFLAFEFFVFVVLFLAKEIVFKTQFHVCRVLRDILKVIVFDIFAARVGTDHRDGLLLIEQELCFLLFQHLLLFENLVAFGCHLVKFFLREVLLLLAPDVELHCLGELNVGLLVHVDI